MDQSATRQAPRRGLHGPSPATRFRVALLIVALAIACALITAPGCSESASDGTPDGGSAADAGPSDGGVDPDGGDGGEGGTGSDDGLHPVLSGFQVDHSHRDRLTFDSSEPITASATTGFIVSGKTLTGVVILPDATTGHYLLVGDDFTFWDNNTIRYQGGGDLQDLAGNELHPFTLRYVVNEVAEPAPTGTVYYVDSSVSSSGNGTSEAQAFKTIQDAASLANAGTTIWVKAGDYGGENVVFATDGTPTEPIRLLGYKTTTGDHPSLTRSVGMAFSSTELPLLSGGTGHGISLHQRAYFIVKNLQIGDYTGHGFYTNDLSYTHFDNIYLKDCDWGMQSIDQSSSHNRLTHSYIADMHSGGVRFQNRFHLIDDLWSVSSKVVHEDYYIVIYGGPVDGGHNIVRNAYVYRYADDTHTGHGISLKAGDLTFQLEYNLIEDCEILNSENGSIELRHSATKHNVIRGILAHTDTFDHETYNTSGINFENGTSYNIVESSRIACKNAFGFTENEEDGSDTQPGGSHNTIHNTIVYDSQYVVGAYSPTVNTNNRWINCTFHNVDYLVTGLWNTSTDMFDSTNEIINCSMSDIPDKIRYGNPSPTIYSSNFYGSWTSGEGPGSLNLDPHYVDVGNGDYTPQNAGLKAGVPHEGVEYDAAETERDDPPTIGALEI